MDALRITLIAFSFTLLVACGGGGSSNTAARTPATIPPTDNGGGGGPSTVSLPTSFQPIENSPTIQDVEETALIDGVRDDMELLSSDLYESGNMDKTDVSSCTFGCVIPVPLVSQGVATAIIPSGTGASLPDLSFIAIPEGTSEITSSVEFGDVTLALGRRMGTTENVPYRFETFAGWLDASIFGTVQMSLGTSGSEERRFVSYIIGIHATSKPTATGSETDTATWEGATVATIKADRTFILGDATITIPDLANADVNVMLDNWQMTNGEEISDMAAISYEDLTLTNGSFTSSASNEQISGQFFWNRPRRSRWVL